MRDRFQKLQLISLTSGLLRNLTLMTTGGVVVIAAVLGIGALQQGSRLFEKLNALFNTSSKPEVDVRSIIIRQVHEASELTTAIFTMESVVPTRQERRLGGYTLGATTLLYIAHGQVRAGVDLKDLQPNDVQVVNNTIQLQLPPPRILDSKIDVNRSQVYDYDRGFLGLGPDVGPQLQTLAQQETLKKIVATACSEGILTQANDRAELVVGKLLNTAGYKDVEVKTQSPLPGSCIPEPVRPTPSNLLPTSPGGVSNPSTVLPTSPGGARNPSTVLPTKPEAVRQ
jgi:hypothetical protein